MIWSAARWGLDGSPATASLPPWNEAAAAILRPSPSADRSKRLTTRERNQPVWVLTWLPRTFGRRLSTMVAVRRVRSVSLNGIGCRPLGSQRTVTTRASAATSPDEVRMVSRVVMLVVPRRSAWIRTVTCWSRWRTSARTEIRHRVGLAPHHVVQDPEPQVLQDRADAEDVVVGADHPQRAVLAQQPAAFGQPVPGERVVGGEVGEAVPVRRPRRRPRCRRGGAVRRGAAGCRADRRTRNAPRPGATCASTARSRPASRANLLGERALDFAGRAQALDNR